MTLHRASHQELQTRGGTAKFKPKGQGTKAAARMDARFLQRYSRPKRSDTPSDVAHQLLNVPNYDTSAEGGYDSGVQREMSVILVGACFCFGCVFVCQ